MKMILIAAQNNRKIWPKSYWDRMSSLLLGLHLMAAMIPSTLNTSTHTAEDELGNESYEKSRSPSSKDTFPLQVLTEGIALAPNTSPSPKEQPTSPSASPNRLSRTLSCWLWQKRTRHSSLSGSSTVQNVRKVIGILARTRNLHKLGWRKTLTMKTCLLYHQAAVVKIAVMNLITFFTPTIPLMISRNIVENGSFRKKIKT